MGKLTDEYIQKVALDNSEGFEKSEDKLPSGRIQEAIMNHGTDKQIKDLTEKIKVESNEKLSESSAKYVHALRATQNEAPKQVSINRALHFINNKVKINKPERPEEINYEISKRIFWDYLNVLVKAENKTDELVIDDNLKSVLPNLIKWMIGDESGSYDIRKSIYIFGQLGTGKSTIALAGHHLMNFYKSAHSWGRRSFKFASMDEIFLSMYAGKNLEILDDLRNGFWCLDELREEHIVYKHYGQDYYIVNDLLSARHSIWKGGTNTIITSNIPPMALSGVLNDARLLDRINQQYTFVEIKGVNKRHI